MKPTKNYGLSDSLIDAVRKSVEEALVGGQKKLDVDKDGKLEKSDFASLRAKKDAVDTKPKLKEDHPDEKEDKALIKKLIKKADVSDDEEDKALIKKTMKKEEEQIDENELDEANRRGGNRFLNTREKDAIQKKMKPLDPNATVKYKDNYSITRGLPHEEQLKRHIHQATGHHVHISPTTHDMHDVATGAKIAHDAYNSGGAGQYGGPGGAKHTAKSLVHAVKKFHKEEYEQMDEVKLADLPRRKVVGKSYGADYVDPEGADETAADMKKAEPKRKSGPQGTMKRRFIKDKSKLRMQYK